MTNANFNTLGSLDAAGMARCFDAYADYCSGEVIESIGFNTNSGYAYIALENGVCIASAFNHPVEYIISDPDSGEELFLDDYDDAANYQPSQVN